MKHTKKQSLSPALVKSSIISFQQYTNRDIFSQSALLYSHQHKLQSNARNRRNLVKNICKKSSFKISYQPPTGISKSSRYANYEEVKLCSKTIKRSKMLNIVPAVIHKSIEQKANLMLSQRAKTQIKQVKPIRIQRSKTDTFDTIGFTNCVIQNDSMGYSNPPKQKTVHQRASLLKKIKIFLPIRSKNPETKEQLISGWQNPFEDEGI